MIITLSWTLLASALGPHDTVTVSLSSWGVPEVHRLGFGFCLTVAPLATVPVPPVTPVRAIAGDVWMPV